MSWTPFNEILCCTVIKLGKWEYLPHGQNIWVEKELLWYLLLHCSTPEGKALRTTKSDNWQRPISTVFLVYGALFLYLLWDWVRYMKYPLEKLGSGLHWEAVSGGEWLNWEKMLSDCLSPLCLCCFFTSEKPYAFQKYCHLQNTWSNLEAVYLVLQNTKKAVKQGNRLVHAYCFWWWCASPMWIESQGSVHLGVPV